MRKFYCFLFIFFCLSTFANQALNKKNDNKDTYSKYIKDKLSLSLAIGLQNSRANEIVYSQFEGVFDSLLTWETKKSRIVNLGLDYQFNNWLKFTFRNDFNIQNYENNSMMHDYDWITDRGTENYNLHSWHTDMKFKTYDFDMNLKAKFYSLNKNNNIFNFYGMIGYELSKYHWITFGGEFAYDDIDEATGTILGTDTGYFPSEEGPGIGYKQKISIPYIGLGFDYKYKKIDFDFDVKYSNRTRRKVRDNHYARDMVTYVVYDYEDDGKFWGITTNLGYWFKDTLKVFFKFDYKKHNKIYSDEDYWYEEGILTTTPSQSEGSSNITKMFLVGVEKKF